jgi:PKD repeat protein
MNQWFKYYFILFFIFLCSTGQAKGNGSFLGGVVLETSDSFHAIVGDSIKTVGDVVENKNDTIKKEKVNKSSAVLVAPDATLIGSGGGTFYNGMPVFRDCGNASDFDFIFRDGSTTAATNTKYIIKWGDGSADFIWDVSVQGTTWNTLVTHKYVRGIYNLTFIVEDGSGSTTKDYIVFLGASPNVSLTRIGANSICNNNSLAFRIINIANNAQGTVYTVSFNDGSSVVTYPQPASGVDFIDFTHNFATTSCGTTTNVGGNLFPDSFAATVRCSNPCGEDIALNGPLYISTAPIPLFILEEPSRPNVAVTTVCKDANVNLKNTSIGGSLASNTGCNTNSNLVWTITPSTYVLNSGNLGRDFGATTPPDLWETGSPVLNLRYTAAGSYTITLKIGNSCGTSVVTNTICVETPLVADFTLNPNAICAAPSGTGNVTVNNNTVTSCGTIPKYLWTVTYATANCGVSATPNPNYTFTNGTDQNSASPSFNFITPGKYTVRLEATNSCGTMSLTKTIEVKKPPTVVINPINNMCGPYTATFPMKPTAQVNSCAPASSVLTYAWSFPGGTDLTTGTDTSSSVAPSVTYPPSTNAVVTYDVFLDVTNECGTTTATKQSFTIYPVPNVANTVLEQTICSGTPSTAVVLISDFARTPQDTYSWTATATAGISGFLANGTGNIPAQTISTTNTNSGSVTYAITPLSFGCSGPITNYVIKVDPAPVITVQPQDNALCQGGGLNPLTVSVGNTTANLTYQWYSNTTDSTIGGTPMGTNSDTFLPPTNMTPLPNTTYYYCTISLDSGACTSITSRAAKITVDLVPVIIDQPKPTQNVCVGGQIIDPLTVTYKDGSGTPTYQWYFNAVNNNTTGSLIIGETNPTFKPAPAALGTVYYYVKLTFPNSGCGTLISATAEVIAVPDPIVTAQPIALQELCLGTTPAPLSVTASGGLDATGGVNPPSNYYNYQWYSAPDLTSAGLPIMDISATTSSYQPPPTSTVGTVYYFCYISQANGLGCDVFSDRNLGKVVVYPQGTVTANPVSEDICVGGTFDDLKVAYTGSFGNPMYQWFSNASASNTGGTLIAGENSDTYTPTGATNAPGTFYYYCEISFALGGCDKLTSGAAILNVNGQTAVNPLIGSQTLCVGA